MEREVHFTMDPPDGTTFQLASAVPETGYTSWREVSGYFDGDGNVGVEVMKRILRIKIRFVDTWRPQIEGVWTFLKRQGLRVGGVGMDQKAFWQAAYRLDVTESKSVLKVAREMARYCVKKKEDLRIAVDYLEGRITGNEALRAFNSEVRIGRRRGIIRAETLPLNREEGLRLSRLEDAQKARDAYAVKVPSDVQGSIRRDHLDGELGHIRLSRKYGYSVSVIRRILGAG